MPSVTSVAEPNHFSSALAPDIFFFRLGLQVKNFGSGSTYKSLAPTGSGSKKQIFLTKHVKNLSIIKQASINLDFVPKTEKTYKNIDILGSQNFYLVLYFTLGKIQQVLFIIQKYIYRAVQYNYNE